MPLLNTADKVYVGSALADTVYLGTAKVWPQMAILPAGQPFITSVSVGGIRTEMYWLGMGLTVGAQSIIVTALGRYVLPGNSGTNHKLNLRDAAGNVLDQVVIDVTGRTAHTFAYAQLATPVSFAAGEVFYVMSLEDLGDDWCSNNADITTTSDLTYVGGAYTNATPDYGVPTPGGGSPYVPTNFLYTIGEIPPPPSWTPDLVAGLEIWLDASQLGLSDGDEVLSWPNLGSGSQPTIAPIQDGAPVATFVDNAANGNGVVRFHYYGTYLLGATSVTHDLTLLYIMRLSGPNTGRCFTSPYPPVNVLIGAHSVGQDCCYDQGWLSMGTPWTTDWRMIGFDSVSPGNTRFYVYGNVMGTNTSSEGFANQYRINGGYADGGAEESMDCDIAEVLIYDSKLTDDDRQSAEGYLAWKWGQVASLSADHPYKDQPPQP